MKKKISIHLENEIIEFFKKISRESGIAYQTIINYYLLDATRKKINMKFITEEEEEDLEDLKEYQNAAKEFEKNSITYTHEEMLKMLEDGENDV